MKGPRKRDIKSKVLRVRLSEDLYRRLDDLSHRTGRSRSEIIRRAVREYLKQGIREAENVLRKK